MDISSLIVIAWITYRLAASFYSGVACDVLLIASWFNIHYTDNVDFGYQFNWSFVPMYCLTGYLYYRLSCMAMHSQTVKLKEISKICRHIRLFDILRFSVLAPVHEEITWRLVLQDYITKILGPLVALALVALLFTAWHRSGLTAAPQVIELLFFSAILGASILITSDPLLPICLHAVRNFFVLTRYQSDAIA